MTVARREVELVVPTGKVRERIDLYLTHHIENATRTKVREAIDRGYVLVDGHPVKPSHPVSPGEIIRFVLPSPAPPDVVPEAIPLDVVYEDEYLLVVNKPAGMVSHPAYGNYTGTLVNALLHHSSGRLSAGGGVARAGIVHRLDKETSGLLVVAKDDRSHALLAKQFADRTIEREYRAVVWGIFPPKSRAGVIDASLGRSHADRKKFAVRDEGKTAVTEYSVVREFGFLSLIALKLRTGRTHQIRVHLQHVGHPVFGDATYGGRRIAWGSTDRKRKELVHRLLDMMPRQALHARTIGFVHPVSGERLRFGSELPADMRALIEVLDEGAG